MYNSEGNAAVQCLCPQCGAVPQDRIRLYNPDLKVQNFRIDPIVPTCLSCASEVLIRANRPHDEKRNLIVLTGTCGAGKTATAETLISRHGYVAIDGDCVIHVVKHRRNIARPAFNGAEVLDETARQVDILLALGRDIILSTVIIADDLPRYRRIFQARNLNHLFILLRPTCACALSRSRTRTCFNGIIDEKWVKHFHDQMIVLEQQSHDDVIVFDNSDLTVDESAERVLRLFEQRNIRR